MDNEQHKKTGASLVGMLTAGLHNIINRIYRETGPFQWLRELLQNSIEAGATRILAGIEWQAVKSRGVYRRLFADNGKGMTSQELVTFFRTLGEGDKPVGGRHENFGVGSKVALLPWNRHGMVVISYQDGDASMIWMMADPTTGEYGLRRIRVTDPATGVESDTAVYQPFNDTEAGCDWTTVAPQWVRDSGHGTVVVLLGDTPDTDTVSGSPDQDESAIKGLTKFLNSRYQSFDGIQVVVEELNTQDKSRWPRSEEETRRKPAAGAETRTVNRRTIRGADHYVQFPNFDKGGVASTAATTLSDGTTVTHVLWTGDRPEIGDHAQRHGYIAVVYRNEQYHITTHHHSFRNFGISQSEVRRNLTLIINPPEATEDSPGVYPGGDRNRLLMKTDANDGLEVPIQDWGAEWAENMPNDVREAIRQARGTASGSINDPHYKTRLAERFGNKWKAVRVKVLPQGDSHTDKDDLEPGPTGGHGDTGGNGAGHGRETGTGGSQTGKSKRDRIYGPERPQGVKGRKTRSDGGIPDYRWESSDEFTEGILASWSPHDPQCPAGVVLLNRDHPVITAERELFKDDYGSTHAEDIEKIVEAVYGEVAVSKIAHSEHLKALLPSDLVEEQMRSDEALTMSLLGLVAEEGLIGERLRKEFRRKRPHAA